MVVTSSLSGNHLFYISSLRGGLCPTWQSQYKYVISRLTKSKAMGILGGNICNRIKLLEDYLRHSLRFVSGNDVGRLNSRYFFLSARYTPTRINAVPTIASGVILSPSSRKAVIIATIGFMYR